MQPTATLNLYPRVSRCRLLSLTHHCGDLSPLPSYSKLSMFQEKEVTTGLAAYTKHAGRHAGASGCDEHWGINWGSCDGCVECGSPPGGACTPAECAYQCDARASEGCNGFNAPNGNGISCQMCRSLSGDNDHREDSSVDAYIRTARSSKAHNGETCTDGGMCQSGFCVTMADTMAKVCKAPGTVGTVNVLVEESGASSGNLIGCPTVNSTKMYMNNALLNTPQIVKSKDAGQAQCVWDPTTTEGYPDECKDQVHMYCEEQLISPHEAHVRACTSAPGCNTPTANNTAANCSEWMLWYGSGYNGTKIVHNDIAFQQISLEDNKWVRIACCNEEGCRRSGAPGGDNCRPKNRGIAPGFERGYMCSGPIADKCQYLPCFNPPMCQAGTSFGEPGTREWTGGYSQCETCGAAECSVCFPNSTCAASNPSSPSPSSTTTVTATVPAPGCEDGKYFSASMKTPGTVSYTGFIHYF